MTEAISGSMPDSKTVAHRVKVFVDFDGTITKRDIGENIFLHFGNQPAVDKIVENIKRGVITGKEGWMQLFREAPGLTLEQVYDYIKEFEIDTSFIAFVAYCKQNEIPVFVLSDGFENYIQYVFEREGLQDVRYFANKLTTSSSGSIQTVFPYTDEECTCCANCKRNHILEESDDEELTVYIGNGSSDTCPAQYCDIVFAKDDLLKFCERERISFFPYNSFTDVLRLLQATLTKKRIKKRHQAVLKRNEVYKLG